MSIKFSIFTPTNDTTWIRDTYQSLLKQTHSNWEWVIVPNGEVPVDLPPEIVADSRAVIRPTTSNKIGALKHYACSQATGDIYVELDHDDILVPWALNSIVTAHNREGPAFHYSDSANFFPDGTPEVYGSAYGWRTYDFHHEGKAYKAHKAFPATPRSLGEIYYAPNHVRAWHKDVYLAAGGHEASMEVGDDHDLVCKTYLAGCKFIQHHECLYLYRRIVGGGKSNSYIKKIDLIAATQTNTFNRYLHLMCEEWSRREGLEMIDLGGAHNSPKNYRSLDIKNADIIHHVGESPLPFKDNSIGILRAVDFFEHVPRDKFIGCMNDFYRVLAPGGWILSSTPSSDGRGAYQDPTHINFMNQNSFWYYTDRNYSKYVPEIKCRFQGTRVWTGFPGEFHKNNNISYVYADLCALKGQHQAGICKI